MYVVLAIAFALLIAAATVWTPIFALIIALPLFTLFLVYVGFTRRADEKASAGASGAPESGEGAGPSHGEHSGVWGERRA